jgi:glycosyltransferase involved in cell wall biosynthesis
LDSAPVKVLYLHMIGAFGGASRSLTEAVAAFPAGAVDAHFVCARGSVELHFGALGPVVTARGLSQFDNTRYSYYRGLRWLVALRELAYIPATIMAIRRAHAEWGPVDLIHVNEFTGLLPWWLARRWFKAPVVVHVRSVARDTTGSLRTRLVNWMFRTHAEAVVAIDETVRASLPADLPVNVIHNAFTPHRVPPGAPALIPPAGVRNSSFKVGFVGNLLKVKGIQELVAAAHILAGRGLDVEFIVVGDDAASSKGLKSSILRALGLQQNVKAAVLEDIAKLGLADHFHMLGFTSRISEAYGLMDVLCFPSHYDAPGRPIFEAAFAGIPSIVALRKPMADTLVNGETGLAVPPRDAPALADAIERLALDRAWSARMGIAAKAMAEANFNPPLNAAALLAVYRRVLRR